MFIILVFTESKTKKDARIGKPMVFRADFPSVSKEQAQTRVDALFGKGKHSVTSVQAWLYDGLEKMQS